jgi:hypothetical protein
MIYRKLCLRNEVRRWGLKDLNKEIFTICRMQAIDKTMKIVLFSFRLVVMSALLSFLNIAISTADNSHSAPASQLGTKTQNLLSKNLNELVEVYKIIAFSKTAKVLRKLKEKSPLSVKAICAEVRSKNCSNALLNNRLSEMFTTNSRIKIKIVSTQPSVKLIFTDLVGAQANKIEYSKLYAEEFHDFDDHECQLYYSLNENEIENVVIIVSIDAPEFKQRACLISQLSRGLGLSLPDELTFSELWGMPNSWLSHLSVADGNQYIRSVGLFNYIHMCSELKAGMGILQLDAVLNETSQCLIGLKSTTYN